MPHKMVCRNIFKNDLNEYDCEEKSAINNNICGERKCIEN